MLCMSPMTRTKVCLTWPAISTATLDDPKVFTRPFKIKFPIEKAPSDYAVLESGRSEGESD